MVYKYSLVQHYSFCSHRVHIMCIRGRGNQDKIMPPWFESSSSFFHNYCLQTSKDRNIFANHELIGLGIFFYVMGAKIVERNVLMKHVKGYKSYFFAKSYYLFTHDQFVMETSFLIKRHNRKIYIAKKLAFIIHILLNFQLLRDNVLLYASFLTPTGDSAAHFAILPSFQMNWLTCHFF